VLRARDRLSRARPALAAASTIFLHSPETIRSIAARTFFEIRFGGHQLVECGERPFGGHWGRDVFHDRHPQRLAAAPQRTETSRFALGRIGLSPTLGSPPVSPWIEGPMSGQSAPAPTAPAAGRRGFI
jgi:hypothetical protein